MTPPAAKPVTIADTILCEKDVKLTTGEIVYVRPWGIRDGHRMTRRIGAILKLWGAASAGDVGLGDLLHDSYDELVAVASETTGIDFLAQKNERDVYALQDLVNVLTAILQINFVERDGLGKAVEQLMAVGEQLMDDSPDAPPAAPEAPSAAKSRQPQTARRRRTKTPSGK